MASLSSVEKYTDKNSLFKVLFDIDIENNDIQIIKVMVLCLPQHLFEPDLKKQKAKDNYWL